MGPQPVAAAAWLAFAYPLGEAPLRHALAVDVDARWASGLTLGVGARIVAPSEVEERVAAEGVVRSALGARIGRWRPSTGLELGGSTDGADDYRPPRYPRSVLAGVPEPVWVDFCVDPARVAIGRVEVAVGAASVGMSLGGRTPRLAVRPLTVGWTW